METENLNEGQPADNSNESSSAPTDNTSAGESNNNNDNNNQGDTLYAGKYKSVEDLEKGYKESTKYARELNSKLKDAESSVPKAPENYEFDFKEVEGLEDVEISVDDPDMKAMIPVFKELNLSQEQASRLVEAHLKSMASLAESNDEIKEKLGENGTTVIAKLQEFTDKLPHDDQLIMQSLADTSAGIDFLYRHLIGGELSTPGLQNNGGGGEVKSAAELKTEAFKFKKDNERSIGSDKTKQDHYKNLLRTALIAEGNEAKAKK